MSMASGGPRPAETNAMGATVHYILAVRYISMASLCARTCPGREMFDFEHAI